METGNDISNKPKGKAKRSTLTPEEKQRLVDFFAVLIEIDRRENVMNFYGKPNK